MNSTNSLIIFKNILDIFKGKINLHLLFKLCSRNYLVFLQVLQIFKSYSGICLEHIKNKHVMTRWMIGKHMTTMQNLRDYEGSSKTFMRQLLYGKYDSFIV